MEKAKSKHEVRYNIGLNSRWPFIHAQAYLERKVGGGQSIDEEEVEPMVKVPVTEYMLKDNLKVRLIGDVLVDRRFLEIEGKRKDIAQIIRTLRKENVRMVKVSY